LRKQIARVLTIIRENRKSDVLKGLKTRTREEGTGDAVKKVETTIKNLKFKHLPLDMRPKRTRAIRRRLTKHQRNVRSTRQIKHETNFPLRKFALKA